jgi:predicted Zn-dependent protease
MDELPRILALYEQGRLDKAEALSAALLARAPDSTPAWALRGQIALRRGLFRDAAEYIERAIAAAPDDLVLRLNLGMAFYGAGDNAAALKTFKFVLKREPSNAVALLYAGRCHLAVGRYEQAASAFNAALKAKPDWADAFEALAALSLAVDRPDKARRLARRALQAEPGRLSGLELLASASERLGDHKTAAAEVREGAAAHGPS